MDTKRVIIIYYKDKQEIKKDDVIQYFIESEEIYKGHNTIVQVQFDSDKIGYFKDSSKTSESFYDKFEYIICQIGKKLGVKMAETYKVYDHLGFKGIISESVFKPEKEKMYMASQLLNLIEKPTKQFSEYMNYIKQLAINNDVKYERPNGDIWHIPTVESEEDIEKVLDLFSKIVKEIEKDEQKQNEMVSDFYKMIMLDLITNNVDRSNDNYGVIIDENGNTRFAPLYDNSTTHIPGIPDNTIRVNGFMIERRKLLNVLFKKHYKSIELISSMCCDKTSELLEYIRRISNQNLEDDESNYFLETITNNILEISNLEKKKRENALNNERNNESRSIDKE